MTNADKKKKADNLEKYKRMLLERSYFDDPNAIPDKVFLEIQGKTIGTEGNFVAITGLPKAGKSTISSALVASAGLKNPVLDIKAFLHPGKNRIGLFDTEQSPHDFKRYQSKVKKFIGKATIPYLDSFLLREDYTPDILQMIEAYLIIEPKCGIAIIDGLLDCIENMNDEGESKKLIRTLKRWGKTYKVLIVVILHVGKKDLSSIGHIGSFVDRYCQSNVYVEADKVGDSITLKPKLLRSAKWFKDINITYDENENTYRKNSLF